VIERASLCLSPKVYLPGGTSHTHGYTPGCTSHTHGVTGVTCLPAYGVTGVTCLPAYGVPQGIPLIPTVYHRVYLSYLRVVYMPSIASLVH